MASNPSTKDIIHRLLNLWDGSSNKVHKAETVKSKHRVVRRPKPCAQTAEATVSTVTKNYTATEYRPIHIENNLTGSVINITACAKHRGRNKNELQASSSYCGARASKMANINVNIVNNFGIIIICQNSQFNLNVQPDSTVEELKRTIQNKEGVPFDQQRLVFGGKYLKDDRTLSNYNIQNGSSVQLVLRLRGGMQIFVKTLGGQQIEINVDPTDTVEELKEQIYQKIGIPADDQAILYGARKLENGRILADYDIESKSTVHVVITRRGGGYQVMVKTSSGKSFLLNDNAFTDTIEKLKLKIQNEAGIPKEKQVLLFHDIILEDDKTVAYYRISLRGSVLDLIEL